MTHAITKEQYINDPCGVCSTAFWKNDFFQKPEDLQILHANELSGIDIDTYNMTRYFRLKHNMEVLDTCKLNRDYHYQTVNIETQRELVSDLINRCYEDISVTPAQINDWTKYSVFDNDLWVFVYEKESETPIALGIADFDKDIKEGSLEWIQVLPEKRGRGFGKALVGELLQRLESKADFVTVSGQIENNANPEAMYRNCGFTGDDVWCVLQKL